MNQLLKLLSVAVTLLFLSCASKAHEQQEYIHQIDSLLQVKQPRGFNGVVLIAQDGKILYSKAYGYSNFDKKTPLKIDDKFSTMSIAKQVTATLIMLEVEKGTIDLHVPIRKYLPDFKYTWADTVTVHHLLNHTSGLESFDINKPLKFTTGKDFSYSNIGYSIAGQILERQSGKTFAQLVTSLFGHCGMTNSAYYTKQSQALLTKGHTIQNDGKHLLRSNISFNPADYFGCHLIVTAADLAKWNDCLHNSKILKPATYNLMINYNINAGHPLFGQDAIGYGYGLRINDKNGFKEIGHTGYHPGEGFTAVNLYYPETHASIVVLENQTYENFDIAYYFEEAVRAIILKTNLIKKNSTTPKTANDLKERIEQIAADKKADVGIAVIGPDDGKILSINGDKLYPMLSTVKFPIALAILHKVEKGELSMIQKLLIKKAELRENTWSPFRKQHPNGNVSITLEEAMTWMVAESDNNLTDVLLTLIGGTETVQEFMDSDEGFIIKNNENDMHQNWSAQFVNKIKPTVAVQVLREFEQGKILNKENTKWLYNTMANSKTGDKRLKGRLPAGVVVAQKTGTSFTNDQGITGAINNIGIIELPENKKIYIAVFVRDAAEPFEKGEAIIADIAKTVYDYYVR